MHSILLQVFRANWYIDHDYAKGIGLFIQQSLEGKIALSAPSANFEPDIVSPSFSNPAVSSEGQSIAIISINQVLMKHDQECGPAGMDTIGSWIKELNANPSIGAIVLRLSTPGGTVEGTHILGSTIKNSAKPIIAYVDEMACSGGYWLASQCSEVWASSPRARVGSIGVMLSFMDMAPYWIKQGANLIEVYSNLSPDKNRDITDLCNGKPDEYIANTLDPLALDFRNLVESARSISDKTILDGRTVFASEGIDIGLVDQIGSIEEVISRASVLAEQHLANAGSSASVALPPLASNSNSHSIPLTSQIFAMDKFPRIAAITGLDVFESSSEGIHVQADFLASIESALNDAEALRAAHDETSAALIRARSANEDLSLELAANISASASAASIAAAEQSSLAERIAEIEAENASIRNAAGAGSATITSNLDQDTCSDENPMLQHLRNASGTRERMEILEQFGYV